MKKLLKLNPDYDKRIYGLDVFRAVAILLVVLTHGGFLLSGPLQYFPWIKLPDGVDLFFVLSGFLIGGIFIKEAEKGGFKTPSSLLGFWKRRWFRTLPAYFLILLLNMLFVKFQWAEGNLGTEKWRFLFFLQNLDHTRMDFFLESWSLSVEEWFYICLPIIYIILADLSSVKQGLLYTCLILILFPFIYRHIQFDPDLDFYWFDVKVRKLVLTRLDAMGFCVVAAFVHAYYKNLWHKTRYISFFAGLVLLFFCIYYPHPVGYRYTQTLFLSLIPFSAALLLPLAASVKSFKTSAGRFFTHISLISYSMYLINHGLVVLVIKKHFPATSFADGLMKYFLFWIIVITASTLLFKFFEKPVMDLRDRKPQPTEK